MLNQARQILKKYFGYLEFREGQAKVIQSILDGNDTFAIMPTGAGKSICYQIPALLLPGITLVISPLISLMKDQVDSLLSVGVPATFINSSLGIGEVKNRLRQAVKGHFKLIYLAPERLDSEQFWALLDNISLGMVAVDEAHCVSQWGHDFRPSYRTIAPMINCLPIRPIISAFTATATEEVKTDIVSLLTLNNPKIYVTGFNRPNLSFKVVKGENKQDYLLKYLSSDPKRAGIIYAVTRKEVERVYCLLREQGYNVGKYHAGLSDEERQKTQKEFLFDDINVIVATNAFGMGIDKSNVRYVIHYNLPKSIEAYYQEAGRAGRDGEPSECILLYGAQDVHIQKFLIEQTTGSNERQAQQYRMLQAMIDYCHTPRCLRKYILEYFGEENMDNECNNCSNCNQETELVDITIEAQKIFSCVYRMNQRWGSTIIAQVLKGSSTKKVLEMNFDKLSTYGIMAEYSIKEIRDMINMLVADQYLALNEGKFPTICLLEKAIEVLKGEKSVYRRIPIQKKVEKNDTLFERLRVLRKEISTREKVPPYIVFADSTLREMSEYCPINQKELMAIKGVGLAKLERYGDEFLGVITEFISEFGLEARKKELSSIIDQPSNVDRKKKSHEISCEMFLEGKSVKEIAAERGLSGSTIEDHLIRGRLEGLEINLDEFIPRKYEDLILQTINKLGGERLRPIKEELPGEIDYMAIKAVLCKFGSIKSNKN